MVYTSNLILCSLIKFRLTNTILLHSTDRGMLSIEHNSLLATSGHCTAVPGPCCNQNQSKKVLLWALFMKRTLCCGWSWIVGNFRVNQFLVIFINLFSAYQLLYNIVADRNMCYYSGNEKFCIIKSTCPKTA